MAERAPQRWLLDFQVQFRPTWCESLTDRQLEVRIRCCLIIVPPVAALLIAGPG